MRVGIIQSAYIPWRGYFDFIDSVDIFVIYDDVSYSKGSWRNRNQIKTPAGKKWLTIPVQAGSHHLSIDEVRIGIPQQPWQPEHRRVLKEFLGEAPYFSEAFSLWQETIDYGDEFLSELNQKFIHIICNYLDIKTKIIRSSDISTHGAKTERLIHLLNKLGATCYISGPAAKDYLNEDMFREHKIRLEYKSYDYRPYPQLYGPFDGAVSILDLIANCGRNSKDFLSSLTPNIAVK